MIDLNSIKDPLFLKDLSIEELYELSDQIREFIIDKTSKNGGHVSGNLGIVELTIALHRFFNNGEKFIFDVGHQCYTHKILTGRAKDFDLLRKHNGLSGFPSRKESDYDIWEVGHASTSLACQAGLIESDIPAISIIGDGALTGGEAQEALEYLGTLNKKAIIILNDNTFSINKNVGTVRKLLDQIRSSRGYRNMSDKHRNKSSWLPLKNFKNKIKSIFYPLTVFDSMGFKYYGPIDGHNYKELFKFFEYADKQNRPVILHVITKKGKGYKYAEEDKIGFWHSVSSFDKETGKSNEATNDLITYSKATAEYLDSFYNKYKNLKVVMPAMTLHSQMYDLSKSLKNNFIDTGITEQFAATFAASLSLNNNVYLPIYSSFLQRAYDQVHQDICMQNLHVVIGVDKAGLVPGNGRSHQGLYDISYLLTIPNLKICAPKDYKELFELLDYSFLHNSSPIAIHYPSTKIEPLKMEAGTTNINENWTFINNIKEPSLYLITYSNLVDYLKDEMLKLNVEVINARFIRPLDYDMLNMLSKTDKKIAVAEEAIKDHSLASEIINYYNNMKISKHIEQLSYPLDYYDIGTIEELRKDNQMDLESIIKRVKELL